MVAGASVAIGTVIPPEAIASGIFRLVLWITTIVPAVVFTVGNPRRNWPALALSFVAVASSWTFIGGNLTLQAVLAVPTTALAVWVTIAFLRADPTSIRQWARAERTAARAEAHDAWELAALVAAEAHLLRDRLERHEIRADDIPKINIKREPVRPPQR